MEKTIKNSIRTTLLLLGIAMVFACSSQKDTAVNRGLQNLSARYNYIYNSKVLLTEYENTFALSVSDTYEEILPVYLMPKGDAALNDKSLTEINAKAQAIISEKNVSNYLDDAYILMGIANYYQGNFFTATEYFDYVARGFPDKKPMLLTALTWKARSQFMLKNYSNTKAILDTVAVEMDSVKRDKGEALATIAQYNIYERQYPSAIANLKAALRQKHTAAEKARWNYIIGQLYEAGKNYRESLDYYNKVVKSNAPFEMYFHANLNRIRVNGLMNGENISKRDQLLALLKDDKNEDYTDQIYYNVAEDYAAAGNAEKAAEYYRLAISKSTKNQYQKGLAYLRMGDISFNSSDYLKAKAYYDSAVTVLPKTFPGYDAIVKKDQNLQYLGDRYKAIAYQDTLQMLAKLPEAERLERINKIITPAVPVAPDANTSNPAAPGTPTVNMDPFAAETAASNNQPASTFYFSNAAALSNGYSDFKRRWGNRQLQDNWRQGTKSAAETATQNQQAAVNAVDSTRIVLPTATGSVELAREYLDAVPLTPQKLEASNQSIINAYLDIAAFYQQELNDKKEAARIYELILQRFPDNKSRELIYYSLYRVYQGEDEINAQKYKDLVLNNYPNSVFARTILDPAYSAKATATEATIQKNYNQVYANYERKQYETLIRQVDDAAKAFPGNPLLSQYAYLRSIAIGRTNNVDSLLIVFDEIIKAYPDDAVITPLVKDHIAYINKNIYEFRTRKYALIDFDNVNTKFESQPVTVPYTPPAPVITNNTNVPPPVTNPPVIAPPPVITPPATNPPVTNAPVTQPEQPTDNGIKTDGTFTNAPSNLYYYVVRVSDGSLTLSSSRFGIGQFNRGNFPDNSLRHQLSELDDDQLIYVGNFATLDAVQRYNQLITPQLSRIMKVPGNTYTSFIISKENFDKLDSREKIVQYLTFYKTSY